MIVHCNVCRKPIDRPPSWINKTANYCSQECYQASGTYHGFARTGILKTCEVCGSEFYVPPVRAESAKFCSKACKGIGSRLPEKACAVCGKMFKPVMGKGEQPCCSLECGHKFRTNGYNKSCKQCGKSFYVPKARGSAKFCSNECANSWQSRNKVKLTCPICHKEFYRSASLKSKYCSIECRNKDPEQRQRLIDMISKQQSISPNKLEITGYQMLDQIGIAYHPQFVIAGKFCVDAYVPSANLVIQFDGDYWHGHPDKFPNPDKRQQKRITLDKSQDAYLEKAGYVVIRVWEHDVKHSPDSVKSLLATALLT